MTGGAGGESRDGGGSDQLEQTDVRPEEWSLNTYVLVKTYILMVVAGLGYLALTWSTVVLLGGFVTLLGKNDFWSLTVISLIQAARIFNDLAEHRFPNFMLLVVQLPHKGLRFIQFQLAHAFTSLGTGSLYGSMALALMTIIIILCSGVVCLAFDVALYIGGFIFRFGPIACIALASWCIRKHNYVNTSGDDFSKANLVPALDIFYILVLCQGALYWIWLFMSLKVTRSWIVTFLRRKCNFPEEWGYVSIEGYLFDTQARCWRDPASIDGRKLIHYAIDLLGSESWEDNLSGARMLNAFIKQGAELRSLLLPSRPKIQKLIDTLGWRRGPPRNREVTARIVADLAGDIHLVQFPGAIRCISSLLQQDETTRHYRISRLHTAKA